MVSLRKSRIPFGIAEYFESGSNRVRFDLSPEDLLISPEESKSTPDKIDEGAHLDEQSRSELIPEQLSPDALAALNILLKSLVPDHGSVLVFEPCRADLQLAILQRGARYVDGGRLLDGRPDPAVLNYYETKTIDMVFLDIGDDAPKQINAPVLYDARSLPFQLKNSREDGLVLRHLGPRDGVGVGLGAWVEGFAAKDPWPFALPGLKRKLAGILGNPDFEHRARARSENLKQSLTLLDQAAADAGFESLVRAGYLWLGIPGFTSMELHAALLKVGVGSFACTHHAYRHRVRLAPPPLEFVASIAETFSQASRTLTT